MVAGSVRIVGLNELSRGLRRMERDAPKAMRLAGNVAARIIVDDAQPKVPTGPGRGGHAKSSIKAASSGKAVQVSAGGSKYPYYPWLDFGGRVGRKKSVRRPFIKQGRYVWKSLADKKSQVRDAYERELLEVARRAGLDVS